MNMGINDDKAHVSPSASSPKVAPTAGGVTAPGVLTFTLEDLIFLATSGDTIGIRKSAAEALYYRGRSHGAQEVSDAIRTVKP